MKDKKKIISIFTSILGVLIVIGFTYAWWVWQGTTNTTANVTIGDLNIIYLDDNGQVPSIGSGSIIGSLSPTLDMVNNNVNKTVTMRTTKPNIYATFLLEVITLPDELKDVSFKWEMYKNGIVVANDNFSSATVGTDITILTNQLITTNATPDTYTLYIWIDGNMDNSPNMGNKQFSFNLKASASNQIPAPVVSSPELADGMIPVKYNGTTLVKADVNNVNNDWYSYDEVSKKWANAIMVKQSARSSYMNANSGTLIDEDDILAYYVWIPRYKYKLWNTTFVSDSPQEIEIVFENKNDTISNGTQNGEYLSHPAFWWDNDSDEVREVGEELSGIWMGKFETAESINAPATIENYDYSRISSELLAAPVILPNIYSIMYYNVSDMFRISQNFKTEIYLTATGINQVDAHMAKKTEWSSIIYLTQSKYGNTNMGTNPSSSSPANGNYKANINLSTTGNIYGIYDVNGGQHEYVMAVMEDSLNSKIPMSGSSTAYNSGFSGKVYDDGAWTQYNNGVSFPAKKYYNLYGYNNNLYEYQTLGIGDGIREFINWENITLNVTPSSPWFIIPGGEFSSMFDISNADGSLSGDYGFRSIIIYP